MKSFKTAGIIGAVACNCCPAACSAPQAKTGDTVQINYTGKLSDGTVFDTSVGGSPWNLNWVQVQLYRDLKKLSWG